MMKCAPSEPANSAPARVMLSASSRTFASGLVRPPLPKRSSTCRPEQTAVDVVAVERLADVVEVVLAELARVVELVAVDEVAEALDGAAHLRGHRLGGVLGLVAAGHEAGDHRAERPDAEAGLQSSSCSLS